MTRHSETLARIPLFRTFSAEAIRRLDSQCAWRRVSAGECILDYKDGGVDIYFVAQGHVRVLIRTKAGRESILRDIRDGEFFGELAAIDGLPRSAAIFAVTDSVIARMPPAIFRNMVHAHADVCDQLLALLASQIRMLANRINEFGTLSVKARIYAELLRLSRPVLPPDEQAIISPPPTHAELAARVGSRREEITRALKHLEREGLLERRRGALVLFDPERLASLIDEEAQ